MFSITDHAPEMPDSPHPWHFGNMKIVPRIVDGIAMLRGIEGNVMPPNGGLDVPARMHEYLDFVIASFHEPVFAPADSKTHTNAMRATIESGSCQIIGHPGNPNYPMDYETIIRVAKDHNVLIEINNSSFTHSRAGSDENCIKIMELVDKLDWKVVFSSDAHICYHLGDFSSSIAKAQAIGFPEQRIVNKNAASFLSFLQEHDKPVASELSDWVQTLN